MTLSLREDKDTFRLQGGAEAPPHQSLSEQRSRSAAAAHHVKQEKEALFNDHAAAVDQLRQLQTDLSKAKGGLKRLDDARPELEENSNNPPRNSTLCNPLTSTSPPRTQPSNSK